MKKMQNQMSEVGSRKSKKVISLFAKFCLPRLRGLPRFQPLALSPQPFPRRGFTTLELLFVILLISLLLALLTPGIRTLHRDSLKRRTQTELQTLAQAIHQYQLTYGTLPESISNFEPSLNIAPLLPYHPIDNPRKILFLTLPPSRILDESATTYLVRYLDPWGSPYRIQLHRANDDTSDAPVTGFLLSSPGPDKTPNTSDDISLHSF